MAKSSSRPRAARTANKRKRNLEQRCIAPPKRMVYPGPPINVKNTDKLRHLLCLVAALNPDIGTMELETRIADVQAMDHDHIIQVLIANGFRVLKRRELESVRINQSKASQLFASAGLRLSQASYMGSGGSTFQVITRATAAS